MTHFDHKGISRRFIAYSNLCVRLTNNVPNGSNCSKLIAIAGRFSLRMSYSRMAISDHMRCLNQNVNVFAFFFFERKASERKGRATKLLNEFFALFLLCITKKIIHKNGVLINHCNRWPLTKNDRCPADDSHSIAKVARLPNVQRCHTL